MCNQCPINSNKPNHKDGMIKAAQKIKVAIEKENSNANVQI